MESTPRFWEAQRQVRVIEAGYRGIIVGIVSWYPDEKLFCCELMRAMDKCVIVLGMDERDPVTAVRKAEDRLRESLADDLHTQRREE